MFKIEKQIHFCYGHRLLNYAGKCRNLHGHNGRAVITLESPDLDALGMVVDFSQIKRTVGAWIDETLDQLELLGRSAHHHRNLPSRRESGLDAQVPHRDHQLLKKCDLAFGGPLTATAGVEAKSLVRLGGVYADGAWNDPIASAFDIRPSLTLQTGN